jgi:hypothetical protein
MGQDWDRRFSEVAVGGIRLEVVGLIWLLFGVILSTWAPELSQFADSFREVGAQATVGGLCFCDNICDNQFEAG